MRQSDTASTVSPKGALLGELLELFLEPSLTLVRTTPVDLKLGLTGSATPDSAGESAQRLSASEPVAACGIELGSTCSLPSRVVARWEKMSKIRLVRSTTFSSVSWRCSAAGWARAQRQR